MVTCFRCGEDDTAMVRRVSPTSYTCDECGNAWTVRQAPPAPPTPTRPHCAQCLTPIELSRSGRPKWGARPGHCHRCSRLYADGLTPTGRGGTATWSKPT